MELMSYTFNLHLNNHRELYKRNLATQSTTLTNGREDILIKKHCESTKSESCQTLLLLSQWFSCKTAAFYTEQCTSPSLFHIFHIEDMYVQGGVVY